MIVEIAQQFAQNNTCIYDLGCSTGTTLINISKKVSKQKINIIGVDASPAMIKKARNRIRYQHLSHNIQLKVHDLNKNFAVENASVVICNLTLQFLDPRRKKQLIRNVYQGLKKGGVFVLVEKNRFTLSSIEKLFTRFYYDFKRRKGYSEEEIMNKQKALQNILVPSTHKRNIAFLNNCRFVKIESFFQWYNFSGTLAIK